MLPPPILLIATKLYHPSPRQGWVLRPALLARLNDGLACKLTLFSAPAGFGKTTLASQWTANCGRPAAWLSLDQYDNDPIQFLRYFVAAVRTCVPNACPTTHELLMVSQGPGVEYLTDSLVSELTALPAEMVLVLDDYHHIHSQDVHEILHRLLRYLPPTLHLVILARVDPPLRLGRLRMAQQFTEVRAGDLRFGPEETRQFLDHRLRQSVRDGRSGTVTKEVTKEMAEALRTRTEGWITGLELASIALQQQDTSDFLARFRGSDQVIVGYLVEEVMAHLSEELRHFLLQISLVDRFCAQLADVLVTDDVRTGSSHGIIAQLEEMNLFIVALDDERHWYRFHDLFRDFLLFQLQRQWGTDALVRLHRRASAWFASVGLIEDALRHALAAGDENVAADLVITQLHPMLDRQIPGFTLMRWLDLFPAEIIQRQPGLLLAQVWLAAFGLSSVAPSMQLADIETLIQADPTLSAAHRQVFEADLTLLRGGFALWDGEFQRAIALLQTALDQQPPTHLFARAQALGHLAQAHARTGAHAVGHTLLRTALTEAKAQQSPTMMILWATLILLDLQAGKLGEALYTGQQAVAAMDELGSSASWRGIGFVEVWYAWVHHMMSLAYYEQNETATAAHHWQQVESMRYRTNPNTYYDSLLGLALIAQANGAPNEARAYAQAAREFAIEVRRPLALITSAAFEVRLDLRNGQTADLLRRTQEIEVTAYQGSEFRVELPIFTRLRALLAVGTPATLTEALALAETCLRRAEDAHNVPPVIQSCALQALILQGLRRTDEAFDALARALTLGEPSGFMRTFLDLGAPLADLLRKFAQQRGSSAYVHSLLAAFAQEPGADPQSDLIAEYVKRHGITPLTPRELEVLTLLSQRFSMTEIADTLVISLSTVKTHTSNIYSKLGVRSGRQAVSKAREVGIPLSTPPR